ncbi:ABC transporter permease [Labrys wisconsinensis]|uniref:ABC-type nitrate/sulfonate/bicarbonate transport system permease component n=1 Tax=Labrys wisconsinensis TaxID=425677 RepID=A0ABU0IZY7_9HYPH|nr:ABC transporter permease subunit [Labrys wisconsinensis]MDQ0467587.1 ABC-type nitrate/sulfonate/bicarbonate transport system permease component [Labrys wisconsinensis]
MTPARRLAAGAAALLAWEVAGRFGLVADGALPAPSAILARFWLDRADYPAHVLATVESAFAGFVLGNAVAIAAGLLFALSPAASRLARGVNIALFALPPIAVVPVLVLCLPGTAPRIVLAALGCYFPVMTATVLGLAQADPRAVDLVRAYGGGAGAVLRLVRWRSALPVVLASLRVAAPNAVLGAILAEFGGGGRSGLGAYLIGSLGRADPARLWGIGLAATAIAGLAYGLFAVLAARATGATRAVTIAAEATDAGERSAPPAWRVPLALGSLLLPFALWAGLVSGFDLPPLIAKTPLAVLDYLALGPTAPAAQARLIEALLQTLPLALAGLVAGLAVALTLALLGEVLPGLARLLMPLALVSQTMPLVALTPLLVLLLGRGVAVTLAITVSVTFFPAFVAIAQGLALVPRAALDLPRAYGAPWWKEIGLVALPAALPHLFAAARLGAPRALLGVMIAEWLATGRGLGNLLNQARGRLDYGMIWSVALISVLVSVALYQGVLWIERRTARRLGAG